MTTSKELSESIDKFGETALAIKRERDEAFLWLGDLVEFLEKHSTTYCQCVNNGDYCDFHEMLYNAKQALPKVKP